MSRIAKLKSMMFLLRRFVPEWWRAMDSLPYQQWTRIEFWVKSNEIALSRPKEPNDATK